MGPGAVAHLATRPSEAGTRTRGSFTCVLGVTRDSSNGIDLSSIERRPKPRVRCEHRDVSERLGE